MNDVHQTRPLEIDIDGKEIRIKLASLPIRIIKDILLINAKCGDITSLSKVFQFFVSNVGKG